MAHQFYLVCRFRWSHTKDKNICTKKKKKIGVHLVWPVQPEIKSVSSPSFVMSLAGRWILFLHFAIIFKYWHVIARA